MKAKKCKDALITAYRIDNQELKRKLEESEAKCDELASELSHLESRIGTLFDEARRLYTRARRAEQMIGWLIAVGNILLNQDGMDNDIVTRAENEWRKLVDEWRQR